MFEAMAEVTEEEFAEWERSRKEPRWTIQVSEDEMEYIQLGLHSFMERQQELADKHRDSTLSRNDVLEAFGAHEDPVTHPGADDGVSMTDMFAAQYVDAKNLLKRTIEVAGHDLAEEGQ